MMHNPPHPGVFLNETVIKPLGLGVTETAQRLGMSRTALSRVLNGKAGISPDLAVQLERAGQSKARFWVNLQANYDLWQATQRPHPDVIKLDAVA
ncbi:HigA family addiction module antitoxin [uncultured Cocleimonas sp.]|uniref:HigA family addiction module antitoxin n=1 Tax=uncultured Cocleimonas sp. TaxID=1051587 RepID=UPI002609C6FC|nr:HigA family addiction module antitoxin [uncultured Cocleimonas sp.]